MRTRLVFSLVLTFLLLPVTILAAVPPMISYQGRLMQPNGSPVADGIYEMRFSIYDTPTGGAPLWSEVNPNVQVKDGLFSVLLGSVINLPANIFDSPSRFFGVTVGSDPEMIPRQLIAQLPFAVRSETSERAASADTVANAAITTSKLADGAVATAKIADGAVTSTKIADSSISTSKINDSAVTTPKIADGAVTAAKVEAQQAWMSPTLLNGWVNYGLGQTTAAYMKDSLGFVHLKGLVKNGAMNQDMFTLPVGYRPSQNTHISTYSNAGYANIYIESADGSVIPEAGGNAYFSIDGISFRAEQ